MKKTFVLFLFITANLFSQTDSTFQFILPELKISQIEKNKNVTYEFENERNMFLMSDSFLIANPDKYNYSVRIADIKKVSVRDGTHVWKTAEMIGGVAGGFGLVVGLGIYAILNKTGGGHATVILIPALTLIGAIAGGLVGGLIGLSVPYYESYPQNEKDAGKKKEILKKIFKSYNLNRKP